VRGRHRGMGAVLEPSDIELQPDGEHVQDHAQEGGDLGRQGRCGHFRPEQRRPQYNAGDHLPDHRRLAQIGKELGQDLPDADDRCERHEDAQQGAGVLAVAPVSVSPIVAGGATSVSP
jgi:hypothetical protein